jgi:DNA-binding transcriptional LysR family regulator
MLAQSAADHRGRERAEARDVVRRAGGRDAAVERGRPVELVDRDEDRAVGGGAEPVGARPPPFAVARRIGDLRRVLCASPAYLKQRPAPRRPADLRDHECVVFTGRNDADTWRLRSRARSRRIVSVRVSGRLRINNTRSMHQAALAGLGIADLPHYLVAGDLAAALREQAREVTGPA